MADVTIDITGGRDREGATPLDDTPFRIALLGDWSGRGSRGQLDTGAALVQHQAHRIDRDDLDPVMAELAPTLVLRIQPDAPRLVVRFQALADFHPDLLIERLPLFQAMRDLRRRLKDPNSFRAAAAELSGAAPPPPARPPSESGADLLGSILDEASPPGVEEAMAEAGGDLHSFIQRVIRPHLVPSPDPRQAELVGQLDAAASDSLRAILRTPVMQQLEGLWRAADLVARSLDTSPDLQLWLIDVTEAELRASLPLGGNPASSPIYQLLRRHASSAPWSLVIGGYTIGGDPADMDLAAQLAVLGQLLRAPWISAAHPRLAGVERAGDLGEIHDAKAPAEEWNLFRRTPLARSLGLILPRFLARLPYGRGLEECETVGFEELEPGAPAEALATANPAFAVAVVLGRAFAEHGWRLAEGLDPDITGLPLGVVGKGVEARSYGPGETLVTERAANRLMDIGLMPLAPLKDSTTARLVRLQSVASPLAGLAGRWSAG